MKLLKKLFAKHRGTKILLLTLTICVILAITAFLVLRANSFQLMCHAYKIGTEYDLHILDEDIVDGVENRIFYAIAEPDSPIKEFNWGPNGTIIARCQKNEWGFWELVDYNHLYHALGPTEYSWHYPAGYTCGAYDQGEEQFEYHSYYTFGSPYDVSVEFLPGQLPENVSASITRIPGAFCLVHISYVATEPIEFYPVGVLEENGMVSPGQWKELDEGLFGHDVDSLTDEERLDLITRLEDVWMHGLTDEENERVENELKRLGVEFLSDEDVKEKFPEAYSWITGAQLSSDIVFQRMMVSLIVVIPLIVIAVPFVIGPLRASYRRKKEARQAENTQDM